MIIIAAETVTGPAKGVFQLLESQKTGDTSFFLFNFKINGFEGVPFEREAKRRGIEVHWLEQKGRHYYSLLRQSKKNALEHRINIVQTHGYKPSVIGLYLKYAIGANWVCFLHGTTVEDLKARIYHRIEGLFQVLADRVVLVCESQRRRIIGGMNRTRVHVIHNAVDLEHPVTFSQEPRHVRNLLGIQEGKRLIAVVGRFSHEKGFDVFLAAFSRVAAALNGVDALLVGDGKERDNLRNQARRLGLERRVHFVGHTDTPGDFMAEADLVVIPSRSEGIPNVALEALALSKPVIATAVGGTPEVIEHGRNGLLVPPEDPQALSAGILRVLTDPRLSKGFASEGLRRLRHSFSPTSRIEKILTIYETLLKDR